MKNIKLITLWASLSVLITVSISAHSDRNDVKEVKHLTTDKCFEGAIHFCGTFPKHTAISTDKSKLYFDRFGNSYNIDKEREKNSLKTARRSCPAGKFNLVFDNSIPQNFRDITCQVFIEISNLLIKRNYIDGCSNEIPNNSINRIEVRDEALDPGVLASASSYYVDSPHYDCGSIAYSNLHEKFSGSDTDQWYDGKIILDMGKSQLYGLSYPNLPISNQYDLYTIMYHEALHLLGFESFIGDSTIKNFTPYDLLLTSQSTNAISSDCTSACFHLDPNINLATSVPPCSYTVGTSGPSISGGPPNDVNSWAHLGGTDCNEPNYLMYPSLELGERKSIHADEIQILCDLGYETTSCSADCFLIAPKNPSDIYSECCNTMFHSCDSDLIIDVNDLLCHSYSNQNITVVDATPLSRISDLELTITGSNIEVHSDVKGLQFVQITYAIDENCLCRTYTTKIRVHFDTCQQGCDFETCENLLCYGDLSITSPDIVYAINLGYPYIFEGQSHNSPDLITEGIRFAGNMLESIVLQVNDDNREDCSYSFSLDVKSENPSSPTNIEIWLSDQPPCHYNDRQIPYSCGTTVDCESHSYTSECLTTQPITGTGFTRHEFNIPKHYFSGNFNYIWLSGTGTKHKTGLRVNNLSLTKECGCPGFLIDSQECNIFSFDPTTIAWVEYEWTITGPNNYSDQVTLPQSNNGNLDNYTFSENGTYEVTLITTDDCGFTTTTTEIVEISCGDECDYSVCIDLGGQPHVTGIYPPVPNMNYPYCLNTSLCIGGNGYQRFIDDLNANLSSGTASISFNHPFSVCRGPIVTITGSSIPFEYVEVTDFNPGSSNNSYNFRFLPSNCSPFAPGISFRSSGSSKIAIYPNPVGDILFVNSTEEIVEVKLLSIDGKLITHHIGAVNQLNTAELDSGVYLLQIGTGDKIESHKIFK